MFSKKSRLKRIERKRDELTSKMVEESKSPDDIASIGFSMVSSAIGARKNEEYKQRIEQYYSDLNVLFLDINVVDSTMLSAYLADFAAGLVGALAIELDISEEQCIQHIALSMEEIKRKDAASGSTGLDGLEGLEGL